MNKRVCDQTPKTPIWYKHIIPTRGNIIVNNYSPAVVMKKIKLGPSDASGVASVVAFLPELTDADESEDFESERVKRESTENAGAVQNEDVSFIQTLTQEELDEHVQKCLEMSSENKINQKNAFALQLIDCFTVLQRKRDFSAMACTLDAGTKIYSYRVDALHQQVMKLADEVVVRDKRKEKCDEEDDTLSARNMTREQRQVRKNNIIASHESLSRKMKGKDPKDKYLRFEALPGAILSGVRRDPIDLSLSLDRCLPFWPKWENYKPVKAEGVVSLPDIKIIREQSQNLILSLDSLNRDQHENTTTEQSIGGDDDANHLFEEIPLYEVVIPDIEILVSDDDEEKYNVIDNIEENVTSDSRFDENEIGVIKTAMDRLQEEAQANGAVNMAPTRTEAMKILFDVSSEYDYLSKKSCNYWAGPEFWKRPQVQTDNDTNKRKGVKKRKEPADIVYDFADIDDRLLKLSKKCTSLSDKTIRKWKKKTNTLPPDLKVDLSWFLNLFNMENFGVISENNENVQHPTHFVDVSEQFDEAEGITDILTDPFTSEHEDAWKSPDSFNVTFYNAACGQSENSDPLNSTFYDAGPSNKDPFKVIRVEVTSNVMSEFGDTVMVPAPKMVNVVPIKYSTRPIRVNMRHLKEAMLEVIREEIEKDAREKCLQSVLEGGSAASKPEVKFRTILKSLPTRLERRTREDLSTAIAVTAVLSLANEHSLQLKNIDDGDFVVRLPDPPAVLEEDPDHDHRFKIPSNI